MAAKIDLAFRHEPAQLKAVAFGNKKGGLGQVIFRGDGLQDRIVEPLRLVSSPIACR